VTEADDRTTPEESRENKPTNFIRSIIDADLASGKHTVIRTRFPPEPNGYLHIGHAKSICLNFGLAKHYQGQCHLRFDDTNPTAEEVEYAESIKADVKWLGFEWNEHLYHASDYFERMYGLAQDLIRAGKAYVCSLSEEEIRSYRGTVKEAGRLSPYRDRSVEENLTLLEDMRLGKYSEGTHVLRAKGDMAHPNMKMRDPLLYRILRMPHDRTGAAWNIYPMYDYAHPLEDAFEHITHSICTLEFENNRDIYNWVISNTQVPSQPRQYEFARLNLNYTVMSKRKLLKLVSQGHVNGWDDPRMPTIAGMRRRGYTSAAIRDFCERIGVAKANSTVDFSMLEFCVRDDLNSLAPRVMAILDPVKLVIDTYPEGKIEELDAPSFPHDVPKEGSRMVPFRREVYIERDDFMENPPKKFFRLAPGQEVRLRYAYIVKCTHVIKDDAGNITEIHCSHDPNTLGQNPTDRKIAGTIHWVPAEEALEVEVRLYDRLFNLENPGVGDTDFASELNPSSLKSIKALVEPAVKNDSPGSYYQFERQGYYFSDPKDSKPGSLVFNRTVGLRDSWSKSVTPEKPVASKKLPKEPGIRQEVVRELAPDVLAVMQQLQSDYGISSGEAQNLASNATTLQFFKDTLAVCANARLVAAWVNNEWLHLLKEKAELPFGAAELGELVNLIDKGTISGNIAKEVFGQMAESGGKPSAIVAEKGLVQVSDQDVLTGILDKVMAENPDEVARFRGGEKKLTGFFMGQIMKVSGGKANPKLVQKLLGEKLGN